MKKVWICLKYYKKERILAPLFKMLEAILELFVPLVMASMIDRGILGGERKYLFYMCGLLIFLGAIGFLCSLVAQYFAAKAAVGVAGKLREDLFAHILGLSYEEMDILGTSTLITRMTSDVNQIQTGVNMTLRLLLRSPFVVFGALIMALFINPQLAIIFVVVIFLLSCIVGGIMYVSIPKMKEVQKKLDQILLKTRENLMGVRVIRSFRREEKEKKKFQQAHKKLTIAQKKAGNIQALLNPLTYVFINLGIILLIWSGGIKVYRGQVSQGEVVALYNYMTQILVELVKLAALIITINKAIASANRVEEVFGVKSSMKEGKSGYQEGEKKSYMVEFQNVSFTYKGAKEASLENLTFKAKKGQIIGIVGGTGSGKSSLVNLIPRFYDATKGKVFVGGKEVKEYTLETLRSLIAVVPQKAVLFRGTIEENLKWGNEKASQNEIMEAIRIAKAEDIVAAKGGLEGRIEEKGRNLSGGQKQRLTIARAFVRKPKILILDDSTSALDLATEADLRRNLKSLSYKPTIFMISQRSSSISFADQILVLEDGKLVGQGTHKQLKENCPVYQEINLATNEREEYKGEKNNELFASL